MTPHEWIGVGLFSVGFLGLLGIIARNLRWVATHSVQREEPFEYGEIPPEG